MPDDGSSRQRRHPTAKLSYESAEHCILHIFVGLIVRTFQLNANAKVVAVYPVPPGRYAGVPCPIVTGDKLGQGTLAIDKKMCGDFQPPQFIKRRIPGAIEGVAKQRFHIITAKTARRQGNIVHHQHIRRPGRGTGIAVGRRAVAGPFEPAIPRFGLGHRAHCVHQTRQRQAP